MGKSQLFTPKSLTSQVSAGDFKSPSHERNDLSHSQVTSLLYCTQHNLCTKNRLSYLRKHIATVSATGFGTGTNRKLHCKNVSISRVCSCSLDLLGDIESPARENTLTSCWSLIDWLMQKHRKLLDAANVFFRAPHILVNCGTLEICFNNNWK